MTIPIARLVSSRFAGAEMPLRLCYIANAYRAVRPQRGQMREFIQAGVELIGAGAPQGTAEVIEVLEAALDAAGLDRAVIGLGDADLYRQLLAELGVEGEAREAVLRLLARTTSSGSRPSWPRSTGSATADRETSSRSAQLRGGARGARRGPRARRRGRRARDRAGIGETYRGAATRAASPTASRSTSACCATSAITRARSSRSTTPRSATSSAAAAATTS